MNTEAKVRGWQVSRMRLGWEQARQLKAIKLIEYRTIPPRQLLIG